MEFVTRKRVRPTGSQVAPVTSRTGACRTFPSFATYMERCLYDPAFGYYGSGRVDFGLGRHYWTYPTRLRPLFGRMLAEAVRDILDALVEGGRVPAGAPLTVLELGAGQGDLAGDIIDHVITHAHEPGWHRIAGRLRYVIGDRSPALRRRQAARLASHIETGWAEVREIDATSLGWDGPFHGVVLANEMLDNFPFERIRIHGRGRYGRIRVALRSGGAIVSDPGALWERIASGDSRMRVAETEEPLNRTVVSEMLSGAALVAYLERLGPMMDDLDAAGLLPVDIPWAAGDSALIRGVASVIGGQGSAGTAILIDYGGTSRHLLDPVAGQPHMRVYGDERFDRTDSPYMLPGRLDITRDVDFSELAAVAAGEGLETVFFGSQATLEAPPVSLDSGTSRLALLSGRLSEGRHNPYEAAASAEALVDAFRASPGFWILCVAPERAGIRLARLGEALPVDGPGWRTLAPGVPAIDLEAALAARGLPEAAAEPLHVCGDPVADLSSVEMGRIAPLVVDLLAERGWLVGAGGVGDRIQSVS